MEGWQGEQEGALLLTNQRSIFVVEKASSRNLGFLVGGWVGAVIAEAGAKKRKFDYGRIEPQSFAADPNNLVVPHGALQRLEASGGLDELKILLDCVGPAGKSRRLKLTIAPPQEMFSERRFQGANRAAAVSEFGRGIMESYRRAMPPGVFQRTAWRL